MAPAAQDRAVRDTLRKSRRLVAWGSGLGNTAESWQHAVCARHTGPENENVRKPVDQFFVVRGQRSVRNLVLFPTHLVFGL